MQGIIYFGHQSLNTEEWNDKEKISNEISHLTDLIDQINKSSFAKVKVPHNWYDERCSLSNFWDKLTEICSGDSGLFGHITQQLFDLALNNCIDKNCCFENALENINNNNASEHNSEFYGAIKRTLDWTNVHTNYHVSCVSDLYHLGTFILAEHQIGETSYSNLCQNVFANLKFHHDFEDTLKTHGMASRDSKYRSAPVTGINGFSNSTTRSLKALNEINLISKSTKEILAEVAARSGFDCTPQGAGKKQLVFTFNCSGKVNCEFHIKIDRNNNNDGVYYQDRIYFGFVSSDATRKIVVAHSGWHL